MCLEVMNHSFRMNIPGHKHSIWTGGQHTIPIWGEFSMGEPTRTTFGEPDYLIEGVGLPNNDIFRVFSNWNELLAIRWKWNRNDSPLLGLYLIQNTSRLWIYDYNKAIISTWDKFWAVRRICYWVYTSSMIHKLMPNRVIINNVLEIELRNMHEGVKLGRIALDIPCIHCRIYVNAGFNWWRCIVCSPVWEKYCQAYYSNEKKSIWFSFGFLFYSILADSVSSWMKKLTSWAIKIGPIICRSTFEREYFLEYFNPLAGIDFLFT